MIFDSDRFWQAIEAEDPRFDGWVFCGVKTTGIYCRPICPARTPKRENVRFFASAAAARAAGFRPCLRCRPETSPDSGAWRGSSSTVSRALSLIEDGALDEAGVDALAARLGVGERQLRRLFQRRLGASPIAVAQTRRIHLAKQLIHETNLPMTEVALASGFGSTRRFNETFQRLYGRPPADLRQRSKGAAPAPEISILLPYKPPYDWAAMMRFLAARAIQGLEVVTAESYSRAVEVDDVVGSIHVTHAAALRPWRRTGGCGWRSRVRSASGAAGRRSAWAARARGVGRIRDCRAR